MGTWLEELAELIRERVLQVGEEAEERVLPQLRHLVPRVEHLLVLVGAGEGELYPRAAVHLPGAVAFAARRLDRAALVDAGEIRLPGARRAAVGLPEEVL